MRAPCSVAIHYSRSAAADCSRVRQGRCGRLSRSCAPCRATPASIAGMNTPRATRGSRSPSIPESGAAQAGRRGADTARRRPADGTLDAGRRASDEPVPARRRPRPAGGGWPRRARPDRSVRRDPPPEGRVLKGDAPSRPRSLTSSLFPRDRRVPRPDPLRRGGAKRGEGTAEEAHVATS